MYKVSEVGKLSELPTTIWKGTTGNAPMLQGFRLDDFAG
jgi:hypothetical protein